MKYDWRIPPTIISFATGVVFLRYVGFTWWVALLMAMCACVLAVIAEEAISDFD